MLFEYLFSRFSEFGAYLLSVRPLCLKTATSNTSQLWQSSHTRLTKPDTYNCFWRCRNKENQSEGPHRCSTTQWPICSTALPPVLERCSSWHQTPRLVWGPARESWQSEKTIRMYKLWGNYCEAGETQLCHTTGAEYHLDILTQCQFQYQFQTVFFCFFKRCFKKLVWKTKIHVVKKYLKNTVAVEFSFSEFSGCGAKYSNFHSDFSKCLYFLALECESQSVVSLHLWWQIIIGCQKLTSLDKLKFGIYRWITSKSFSIVNIII